MMKLPWFRRKGLFFVPSSLVGWLLFSGFIAYAVYTFMEIDSMSHSVSDTLMNFVFKLLILAIVYTLIAIFTSRTYKK